VKADSALPSNSTTAPPTTAPPTTAAPTTEAPTTAAPTTEAPTTAAPTTAPPTTAPPTTEAPTTEAPTTAPPTTEAPTTEAPTTEAPTTEAPTTEAPTTAAPTTAAPTTAAPTTAAPTTAAPTTAAPTTAAPANHDEVLNVYKVIDASNKTCLMMTLMAHFNYKLSDNSTEVVNISSSYKAVSSDSDCGKLTISQQDNILEFIFKYGSDNKTYYLDEVTLQIQKETANKSSLHLGEVGLNGSYLCASGAVVDFGDGQKLVMDYIQFQAFGMTKSSYSSAQVCPADANSSVMIPIIVGSCLAGLIFVIFIIYCIGRRRTSHIYETM